MSHGLAGCTTIGPLDGHLSESGKTKNSRLGRVGSFIYYHVGGILVRGLLSEIGGRPFFFLALDVAPEFAGLR